jgi:hypothetical protein
MMMGGNFADSILPSSLNPLKGIQESDKEEKKPPCQTPWPIRNIITIDQQTSRPDFVDPSKGPNEN